ncbi:MAG: universal stress protein [Comamonadaceae bacterium]|nr:MAG: universal stress protein [Comamonadaceae bacterium]
MLQHIVLATDGNASSEAAARVAVQLARELHSGLTAVCVIDPYPYLGIGEANPLGLQAYLAAARDHAAAAHARVLDLAGQAPAVEVDLLLIEDAKAADGILEAVRRSGASLLVCGAHARHGLERWLPGSVAQRLLALSPVPVLAVPTPGRMPGDSGLPG